MNSLRIISKYRTQLMGVAMIWVLLYHLRLVGFSFSSMPIVNFLMSIGYGGVDVFLFLSAFGLYFSMQKNRSISQFYKKRFFRVFPIYIVVVLFSNILIRSNYSIISIFCQCSTLGFWIFNNDFYEWYVPSIVILYLFFPFYLKIFKKNPKIVTSVTVIGVVLLRVFIYIWCGNSSWNGIVLFLPRIPIFVIGIYIAYLSEKESFESSIPIKIFFVFLSFLALLGLFYIYLKGNSQFYGLPIFLLLPIIPIFCLYFGAFLDILKYKKILMSVLSFFGLYSLEIYLIHYDFFFNLTFLVNKTGLNKSLLVIISIILIMLLSFFTNRMLKRLFSKQYQ